MDITKSRLLLPLSLFIIFLIIVLLPLHPFLSTWLGTSIGPLLLWKSWKELLIVSTLISLIIFVLMANGKIKKQIFTNKIILLILSFAVLCTVSTFIALINGADKEAIVAGSLIGLRYFALFVLAYITISIYTPSRQSLEKRAMHFLVIVGVLLSILGAIQVFLLPKMFLAGFGYDALFTIPPFLLVDDNPNALRAFATLRGPNDYGAYLIMSFIATLALFHRYKYKAVAALGIILVGILLSASRSAFIGLVVATVVYVVVKDGITWIRKFSTKQLTLVFTALLTSMVLLAYISVTYAPLRLAVFHSSPSDAHLFEGSTEAHFNSTYEGMKRIDDNALGCGMGCAGPASYYSDTPRISENYYVQIAEEVGVFGVLIWLTIFVLVMKQLYEIYKSNGSEIALVLLSSGAGIATIGLLLHVWADDPLSMTWWALAGIVLGVFASQKQRKPLSL